MNDTNDTTRIIPAEQVQGCEAWQMPVLEGVEQPVSVVGRQKRRPARPQDPFAGPMTASKAQAIQEQAHQEGVDKGYQAGLQQAETEINQLKAQLNHLMGQLIQPLQEQQHELEQALVHLAGGMARALIKNLPHIDEQAMLSVARQALAELPEGSENIRLLVHPRDAELLTSVARQHNEDWQIISDPSLLSGGCIIKSKHSFVDFTLEARFQLLLDQMLEQQLGVDQDSAGEPG